MTTNNNLDALFADAELPFGHPGRRFDNTPEGFDRPPLVDQGPEPDYTPDEDGGMVHYAARRPPPLRQRRMVNSCQLMKNYGMPTSGVCIPAGYTVAIQTRDREHDHALHPGPAARERPREGRIVAERSAGPARTAARPAGNRSRTVDRI